MKICFLAHASSVHTRFWAHYFRDQGHQVSVVSLTSAKSETGIDLHYLPHSWRIHQERTNWHYLLQLPRLWKTVRNIEPDLLNAHFLTSYGLLGALIRPAGCPLVISLHGSDILLIPERSFLHKRAARFSFSRAHMVTSAAQHMTEVLTGYIAPGKPVLTVQYGVDTRHFFPPSASASRTPVCLSTRKMMPIYNPEVILIAVRRLEEQGSPIRIQMANNGELLHVLQQKTVELQLENRIKFLGRIDCAQMSEALRSASLYVSMSLSDGTSLSLLEAMACGTFPIVSDIPANREWITDGVNGYLVPVDVPEKLAQRLTEAWQQPELRRTAAEYNWALVQEKGNYQKNMATIESAFVRLVKRVRETRFGYGHSPGRQDRISK